MRLITSFLNLRELPFTLDEIERVINENKFLRGENEAIRGE